MQKPLSLTKRSLKIENLVVHLTTLQENWDKDLNVSITKSKEDLSTPEEEEDPIRILATKINSANAVDHTGLHHWQTKKPKQLDSGTYTNSPNLSNSSSGISKQGKDEASETTLQPGR